MVDYFPAGRENYKQPYIYMLLNDNEETAFELRYSVFTGAYFFDGPDTSKMDSDYRKQLLKDIKWEYGDFLYRLKADTEYTAMMNVNDVLPMWEYE
jgi:hypothetical protein